MKIQMTDFDMKLEVVVIPVADIDRAKRFYASSTELATALRRAAAAHGEHEKAHRPA